MQIRLKVSKELTLSSYGTGRQMDANILTQTFEEVEVARQEWGWQKDPGRQVLGIQ